jgi:hypothetical protein
MTAQKAMLNRENAPTAQLFAISEQAEIRYTNCGLLYEVPADEVPATPRSASGSTHTANSGEIPKRCVRKIGYFFGLIHVCSVYRGYVCVPF